MTDQWPDAPCCWPDYPGGCICPPMEKALRAWKAGRYIAKMTPEQREACLTEIDKVEGYRRAEHETESDGDLANTVLSAWVDYCRDKGMIL